MSEQTKYLDDAGGVDLTNCHKKDVKWVKSILVDLYLEQKLEPLEYMKLATSFKIHEMTD